MFFQAWNEAPIEVPEPFKRVMTPLMVKDNAGREIPFSVHFTEWEPGKQVDPHIHPDSMEAMLCISGKAHAKIDGKWVELSPGAMIVADRNEEHCIINDGEENLKVVCIINRIIGIR